MQVISIEYIVMKWGQGDITFDNTARFSIRQNLLYNHHNFYSCIVTNTEFTITKYLKAIRLFFKEPVGENLDKVYI